jgi:hypothetical protein
VPHKGAGPALIDLIGGQTYVMFDNLPSSIEHQGGQVARVGCDDQRRSAALPDVPTKADNGSRLRSERGSAWLRLGACRNRQQTNRAINDTLLSPRSAPGRARRRFDRRQSG